MNIIVIQLYKNMFGMHNIPGKCLICLYCVIININHRKHEIFYYLCNNHKTTYPYFQILSSISHYIRVVLLTIVLITYFQYFPGQIKKFIFKIDYLFIVIETIVCLSMGRWASDVATMGAKICLGRIWMKRCVVPEIANYLVKKLLLLKGRIK